MKKTIISFIIIALLLFIITLNFNIGNGLIFIISLRLLIPFTIFKWPFYGIIASLLIDLIDVVISDFLGSLGTNSAVPGGHYDRGDKIFDMFYLSIALVVSINWKDKLAKYSSIYLFIFRLIGVILFEMLNFRILLLIFPNLFENWFIFWAARNKYFSKFRLSAKRLVIILVLLLIPKLIQEYFLHYAIIHPWTKIKTLLGIF